MSGLVLDTSAVVAMLTGEPEGGRLRSAFVAARPRWIGAVGVLECGIVLEKRLGVLAKAGLYTFLSEFEVHTLAFDEGQAAEAQAAWRRFGKGRHPAALNLGDCCAYAAAKALGLPLLHKGEDFRRTDIPVVDW